GGALPGVAVSATSAATGVARTTVSGRSGAFTFPLLPVGLYAVSAELQGFAPKKIANVSVTIGADTTLTLTMDPAGVEAAVTVSAASPMVETTKSEVSSVVNERAIANLPTNGRNFIEFVLTTPDVVKDNFRVGDIVFAGQRGTLNSLVVDGGDNNNTFY